MRRLHLCSEGLLLSDRNLVNPVEPSTGLKEPVLGSGMIQHRLFTAAH